MLSIIISSYQPHYYQALEKNIAETIGIPYEVIKVDNPGKMGICEAYNHGAQKAQYDYLLFLHEDVLFNTQNWGQELITVLEIENCGVVGIAGSNYYGYIPSSWWHKGFDKINIIQYDKKKKQTLPITRKNFNTNNSLEKVKVLDGVFLACKSKIYRQFPFDERLRGYHGYDILFSLKISKLYQNYITDKILITHYSFGNLSKEWLNAILKVRKIWSPSPDQHFDKNIERENFYLLINFLTRFEYTKKETLKIKVDFVTEEYRDFKLGKYFFEENTEELVKKGYKKVCPLR